jgi:predicted O-linked N-acetylglucosamine transferase (SPINDLY family)
MRTKKRKGDWLSHSLKQTKPPQSPESVAALQKALRIYREGRLEQAEAVYLAIIAKAPDYFDAHLMLGDVLAELQRHDAAIASYDRALQIKPDNTEALYNRGNSLLHLNRNEEAAASYDRALASTPDHVYALYNHGNALLGLGRREEAIASYDQALAVAPGYAEAWNNRGNALLELKRFGEALSSFERALAIAPDYVQALYNRGNALWGLVRREEAIAGYARALAIEPHYVDALYNRGNVLLELERYDAAVASYDRALAIKPDHVHVLYNRGNAFLGLKLYDAAVASYDQALTVNTEYAEAWNNRGNALLELGRYAEVIVSCDRALAIKPDYAEAWNNRGSALVALKRHHEALASLDWALAMKSDLAQALYNRGNALSGLKRYAEALASLDRAVAVDPDYAEAWNSRGNALLGLKWYEAALASYERALAIEPEYGHALYNRGNTLFALERFEEMLEAFERLLRVAPDYDYGKGYLLYAKLHCCDWEGHDQNVESITRDVVAGKRAAFPFIFLCASQLPSAQLQCAQTYANDQHAVSGDALWKGERYHHDRIRLAYLSADFREHAVAYLIAGLFEAHDKSRFETTAKAFGPDRDDEMRARIKASFNRFIDVRGERDADVARLLRELEIDIAVDLQGYTTWSRARIFGFRPAPIQVNFLGYPGTMGINHIDYILADRFTIPQGQHSFYAEKVVYLPDTYQPNDSRRHISDDTPTRAEAGLPETGFVFCSFNNSFKIAPPVFDLWMRLLHQVEGSVLWLVEGNATAVRNLRRRAESRGIAPERLVFAPRLRGRDHLARHRLAGLFLDNLPYNAHTTASDALWAGLPVVTCLGSSFAGRVAGSLLNAVGLPELITENLDDYEQLALKLARDERLLAALKAKLARNRDIFPLFDTDRFRQHIESAYETMWERYERGGPPVSFTVPQVRNLA